MLRSPIICVLGHVDHGKTRLLDQIRGTGMVAKEAGRITQHVGASILPKEIIDRKCGKLLKKYGFDITLPGLLFIDTPGHEAFSNLRKRGGVISDLAVLVIDITQGVQPQTIESIEILKENKVPFIIAANKIDVIQGWISNENKSFTETFSKQRDFVQEDLDNKIYNLVGKLGEYGFNSERFDRIEDLTKNIIIVPISAETGEGFEELLMFLSGLAEKFMKEKLDVNIDGPAKGTVLEVKEIKGLGTTLDVILYEGKIKQGDTIAAATKNDVVITTVRSLLLPAPLEEIRDTSKKFKSVKEVYAASGIKIAGPDLEDVLAGSPLIVVEDVEEAKKDVRKELDELKIHTDKTGVILKADALGSLEAIVKLFGDSIKVKKADVGLVTKYDLVEASSVKQEDPFLGVIFSFNQKNTDEIKKDAKSIGIPLFESDVIYRLKEMYEEFEKQEKKNQKDAKLKKYIMPAKLHVLPGCIFRATKPAVVGVKVMSGEIKSGYPLIRQNNQKIGNIDSIQDKKKTIDIAEEGQEVAIAISGATVGRNLKENDILFTDVPKKQLRELIGQGDNEELIYEILKIKEE
jgi:translation initiation factor 5B